MGLKVAYLTRITGFTRYLQTLPQSQCNQCLLLQFVRLGGARSRRGVGSAFNAAKLISDNALQAGNHKRKCSHVRRLLLHPDELGCVGVAIEFAAVPFRGKGKLFEEDDCGMVHLCFVRSM